MDLVQALESTENIAQLAFFIVKLQKQGVVRVKITPSQSERLVFRSVWYFTTFADFLKNYIKIILMEFKRTAESKVGTKTTIFRNTRSITWNMKRRFKQ